VVAVIPDLSYAMFVQERASIKAHTAHCIFFAKNSGVERHSSPGQNTEGNRQYKHEQKSTLSLANSHKETSKGHQKQGLLRKVR
jgi:hypothetical protein